MVPVSLFLSFVAFLCFMLFILYVFGGNELLVIFTFFDNFQIDVFILVDDLSEVHQYHHLCYYMKSGTLCETIVSKEGFFWLGCFVLFVFFKLLHYVYAASQLLGNKDHTFKIIYSRLQK